MTSVPPVRCFECKKPMYYWETFWALTNVTSYDKLTMIIDENKRKMSDEHALDKLRISKGCCRNVYKNWIDYNNKTIPLKD